ncbi:MAG: sortase [Lachnospirales bacterium]
MKNKIGVWLIIIGCIMILSGMVIVSYNIYVQKMAENTAYKISAEFENTISKKYFKDKLITEIPKEKMKITDIDGYEVIGKIFYPRLDIELPVVDNWDYKKLKISVCRYSGSLQSGNLIIMAHNYPSSFGKLKRANYGDNVQFKDSFGTVYSYTVDKIEEISGDDINKLVKNSYDMTLFTCTYSGKDRIVVRLKRLGS